MVPAYECIFYIAKDDPDLLRIFSMTRSLATCSLVLLSALLMAYYFIYVMILRRELRIIATPPSSQENESHQRSSAAVFLWWTPFLTKERLKTCGHIDCLFTANRSYYSNPHLKGLIFYGSSIDADDMPPRGHLLWGLFHEESPRNVPILSHDAALSLFNYSATFSRASHLALTLQFLPSLDLLISRKFYKTFDEKQQHRDELAPVMYLQSDCSTPNNRDTYVEELMKYIRVDSYGECLNNRPLPDSLSNAPETMMSDQLLNMTSLYKFAVAFENAVCEDYITEKLWRPLIAGTVPIYVGSPSIRDWLPNNNSAILALDFDSPELLAAYLNFLDHNKEAYESHRQHKTLGQIANQRLIHHFYPSWPDDSLGAVDDFECLLCVKSFSSELSVVNKSHYDCPEPRSILTGRPNESNWWYRDYLSAGCEADAFKNYVVNKAALDEKFDFDESACKEAHW